MKSVHLETVDYEEENDIKIGKKKENLNSDSELDEEPINNDNNNINKDIKISENKINMGNDVINNESKNQDNKIEINGKKGEKKFILKDSESEINSYNDKKPKELKIININFIPRTLTKLNVNYLNSVLQFLGGIHEFIDYFIKNTNNYKNNVLNNNKSFLSFVTSRLYYRLFIDKERTPYNSNNYLTTLLELNKCINIEKMMNPNGILTFILNQLHDEVNESKKEKIKINEYNHFKIEQVIINEINMFNKENNSIITQILNYCQIKTYNCNYCHNSFYETQNFFTFRLNPNDIENYCNPNEIKNITIMDCLKNESCKNNINYYCPKCNSYKLFDIYYKFYEIGKKIIFLIDRDTNNISSKIHFEVEEKIDLKEYIYKNRKKAKYELCGIISLDKNKENNFVSFIKCHLNQKWYLFIDDIYVEKKNINEILNDNNNGKYIPYTLMYSEILDE